MDKPAYCVFTFTDLYVHRELEREQLLTSKFIRTCWKNKSPGGKEKSADKICAAERDPVKFLEKQMDAGYFLSLLYRQSDGIISGVMYGQAKLHRNLPLSPELTVLQQEFAPGLNPLYAQNCFDLLLRSVVQRQAYEGGSSGAGRVRLRHADDCESRLYRCNLKGEFWREEG